MCQRIFRIVFCSRNRMVGQDTDVKTQLCSLLRSARRNNAQAGVTGALFFNNHLFAQVLEGDYVQVQRVFERVQRDARHADVVILKCGYTAGRDFGDWSMAYAGASATYPLSFGTAFRHEAETTGTSRNGEAVLAFLRDVIVQQQVWALPEPVLATPTLTPAPAFSALA